MIVVSEAVSTAFLFKAFHLTGLQLKYKMNHAEVCLEGGEGRSLLSELIDI